MALMGSLPVMGMAQEPALFNQHNQNPMVYNPAYAGDREIPGLTLLSRQQWIGWEGSPSVNRVMAHTKLRDKHAGTAASLYVESMGPVWNIGITGAYSYTIHLTNGNSLAMGLQGEVFYREIRLTQVELIDQGDPLFSIDPWSELRPNAGLGLVYQSGDYRVNLSVPRLLNSELSPYRKESSRWSTTTRILYLGGAARYTLNEELKVVPSLLLAISRGNSLFVELSGILYYRELMGLGAFYRLNKTLGFSVRYNHQQRFIFGYGYDISFNMTRFNAGTHELFLGYNFPFNKSKTLSPRRF
jgi:type IX secretion system PorP/SprF family membrane protein